MSKRTPVEAAGRIYKANENLHAAIGDLSDEITDNAEVLDKFPIELKKEIFAAGNVNTIGVKNVNQSGWLSYMFVQNGELHTMLVDYLEEHNR